MRLGVRTPAPDAETFTEAGMQLTVRMFGLEVLSINASTEDETPADDAGECTTTGFGFTSSHGDQRWSEIPGVDE